MIGFFPQLYPDELWYSVIMRYHLHAGIAYWSDTLQLLFPDCRTYPKVGELLPNTTMQQLQRVLPEGTLDLRELALNHSLFRFRLLFLPSERKNELLTHFCNGEDIAPSLLTIPPEEMQPDHYAADAELTLTALGTERKSGSGMHFSQRALDSHPNQQCH